MGPGELSGRTALVTGAGVRLGRAIALELARGGSDVVVHYHSSRQAALETVEEVERLGTRAVAIGADLSRSEEVSALFAAADRFGTPDLVVLSAGLLERLPFDEIDEGRLRRMLDVNFVGPFLCAREAARRMRKVGQGDLITILDVGGTGQAWKNHAHYCSAKAALAMLTRVLAVELAPQVRVNGVAPGAVLFPSAASPAARDRVLARVPMGREGSPDDVARTVRFLAGGPRYLTGQIVAVDGGRSAAG